jgi:hypothetical protein
MQDESSELQQSDVSEKNRTRYQSVAKTLSVLSKPYIPKNLYPIIYIKRKANEYEIVVDSKFLIEKTDSIFELKDDTLKEVLAYCKDGKCVKLVNKTYGINYWLLKQLLDNLNCPVQLQIRTDDLAFGEFEQVFTALAHNVQVKKIIFNGPKMEVGDGRLLERVANIKKEVNLIFNNCKLSEALLKAIENIQGSNCIQNNKLACLNEDFALKLKQKMAGEPVKKLASE